MLFAFLISCQIVVAQGVKCDPTKVVTADQCAKCHVNAVSVWKTTPHFQTYRQLSRNPAAKEIQRKMGVRSVKRSNVCIDCHFTTQVVNGKRKAVSGISCESCHGAAKDWIGVHSDYGGATATKAAETATHASQRLNQSIDLGMRNTRDLYSIASSCMSCHTIPNEKLVNVGGHGVGNQSFELVAWSQGRIRHNFVRSKGTRNAVSSPARLRVMYVVGMIADLEYSTRATAKAKQKSKYGLAVANRAASVAVKLFKLQQTINEPNVQMALEAFATAELAVNNEQQLNRVADQIRNAGKLFASRNDGSQLSAIDPMLPSPSQYK